MPPTPPSRRDVLEGVAAASLLAGCNVSVSVQGDTDSDARTDTGAPVDTADTAVAGPPEITFDPSTLAVDEVAFPWSVQAGAMEPYAATLVTKVKPQATVLLRVWRETAVFGTVLLHHEELVTATPAGFLRVRVAALEPGAWHHYGYFRVDTSGAPEARSILGRFRTPPLEGTKEPLTISAHACNGPGTGFDDAMGRLAEHEDVDLLIHLGDMAYCDGARSLEEYRRKWQDWMASDGYKRGLAAAGLYACWDDHEVDNNWDPETISQAQREAALLAFVEHVAVEPGDDGRLWRSYRWGDTAEIFVLDCRGERRPSTSGGNAADDVYLSRAQLDWLKEGLQRSPCHFKLVMSSVPITIMPFFGVAKDDRWEGYPGQRSELVGHIRDLDLRNVWFLGGDFHINFVGTINKGGQGRLADTWEIAVTSGNINPAALLLQPPQFRYATAEPRLSKITFDPSADKVTIRFYDPADGALDRELELSQP
ncbi:MAG: alkaline phosphatase D family protein [Alphaproteobacteria bacterium]|nr:alkaline phosphatase D family protein [Alphaproteobacteria bacterium]